ncbi:virulence sensor histidine kinase PhoQ [Microbulbifer aestuariivivens]|uniref:histidine kinase n=1 Tax=Microbulbifer aestuariivivens TaxID=1908308 RepID=A0ABP9WKN9_9GAMM
MWPHSLWPHSLKARLSLLTTVVLVVFVLLISGALEHAFRTSLDAAKERELQLHIYTLLAVAEPDGDSLRFPPVLPEQRFNQPDSGLIGAVTDASGRVIWRSESALTLPQLPASPLPRGREAFDTVQIAGAGDFIRLRQGVAWGLDNQLQFTFVVLEDAEPLRAQLSQFRATLWRWLGLGALLLILSQWLVLRWGLAPLRQVALSLQAMQCGGSDRLEGRFPQELKPLTDNLNLLIENERRQREKTRHTLADLAHSLKTPLAVMKGLNFSGDQRTTYKVLMEQVRRMDDIIRYQLQRAVTGSPRSILRGVAVAPQLQKILDALAKVYRDHPAEVQVRCTGQPLFYGDEGDLLEVLGNLLDNAYKYGGGSIRVDIANGEDGRRLHIQVEDNGPGIDSDAWQSITRRGVRADQQPGQGIGLAVVVDIVSSYEGEIGVSASDLGGTAISLTL